MAARKNTTPAQIINHLRKAEVDPANGRTIKEVCKGLGISEHTYYRWRREYGGMNTSQGSRGSGQGKLLSPERPRRCVVLVQLTS